MTDFNQASEVLERMSNQFAGLLDAAAALKELGGIAAHAQSLTAQVADLNGQAQAAQAELDRINAAVAQAAQAYDDARKQAEADAQIAKASAQQEVLTMIEQARAQAAQIVADAQSQADAKVQAAGATVANLVAKVDDMNASMKQAADARDAALAELADLNNKIAAARATVKQMIGA